MGLPSILGLTAGLVFLALALYAVAIEPYRVRASKIEIQIAGLPEAFDGFRICHLSDTHVGRYGCLERIAAGKLRGIEADLLVVTGDLIDRPTGIDALHRMLDGMNPTLGTFAVPGNGEHTLKMPISTLADRLQESGIHLLVNSHVALSRNGSSLYLAGVDDAFSGCDDLESAMSGIPEGLPTILLTHSPDILMRLAGRAPDLILAGHTHGGQIRFPFIGALWLHSRYRLRISQGYFGADMLSRLSGGNVGAVQMYVSRGLGGSGIRSRLLCPPEIALITLHRKFKNDYEAGISNRKIE